jgi:hypothetical protein
MTVHCKGWRVAINEPLDIVLCEIATNIFFSPPKREEKVYYR